MKSQKIYNTDDQYDYPDDPRFTREASLVVICSAAFSLLFVLSVFFVVGNADKIDDVSNQLAIFMYHNPALIIWLCVSALITGVCIKFRIV